VDLRQYLVIARTWFPLVVASVLLAAAAAFAASSIQEKVYESKATLIVGQSLSGVNPDYTQLLASQRLSTTYAAVARTRPNAEAVIEQLGLDDTPDELLKRVVAEAPADSTLVTITAQDPNPERAAAIANAFAGQLIEASPAIEGRQTDLQESIDADLKATEAQIASIQARMETLTGLSERTPEQDAELATLEGRLVSLRSTYATLLTFSSGSASNLLSIIEPAAPPDVPISPRPLFNAIVAAVLGLFIAIGIAWVAHRLSDTIDDADDVQDAAGLSTLGAIARMRRDAGRSEIYQLAALLYPRSGVAEAYRTLRTNIEFASVDAPVRSLLVTSSIPGEGKTVIAANLAVVFAQAGRSVLLVDADLRRPGAHLMFDLPNANGLTTLLRSDDVSPDAIAQATEQDNLRVLSTGPLPPNPAELLASQRMRAVLERLGAAADLLIFDSPPLQAVADAAILSSFLDSTILVVDASRSHKRAVHQASEALVRADAKVLGAVLNRVPARARSEYADYYGGVYGVESSADPQGRGSEGSTGPAVT
jgi:succinoglycan biosynthesis transport protein ExoP